MGIEQTITKPDRTLEVVKRFFVDPKNPDSAQDLAQLGQKTIIAMAQMYATGGNIEQMTPEVKSWLTNPTQSDSELEQVMGEVLKRETKTRRFDRRFVGQIHPQGNKSGILSGLVAAYMNTNRIFAGVSQSEGAMEFASIRWLAKMFGYESSKSGGNLTVGGTDANIEALWIAREKTLAQANITNSQNTLPMFVLASDQVHYSVNKACNMLGLNLVTIGSEGFKINVRELDEKVESIKKGYGRVVAIVGIAGETETGMVEDLEGIAEVAKKHDVYFHVDAAYGGPFVLSRAQELFKGISQADSITVDPHKMLYTPYPAGAVLLRDRGDHFHISKEHNVRYLRNLVPRVIGSMPSAGAISTWATIKLLGAEGIASLLNHTLDLAEYAYQKVNESPSLRPLYRPELNTLLIGLSEEFKEKWEAKGLTALDMDGDIKKMEEEVYGLDHAEDGYLAINSDTDNDSERKHRFSVFRYIGMHPYTTEDDVSHVLKHLERTLDQRMQRLVLAKQDVYRD